MTSVWPTTCVSMYSNRGVARKVLCLPLGLLVWKIAKKGTSCVFFHLRLESVRCLGNRLGQMLRIGCYGYKQRNNKQASMEPSFMSAMAVFPAMKFGVMSPRTAFRNVCCSWMAPLTKHCVPMVDSPV